MRPIRAQARSTNPLESFNREIGRSTDDVGFFPDDCSLVRLPSMLAIETSDEWLVGGAYVSHRDAEEALEVTAA